MVAINTINSKVGVEKSRSLKKGPWTTAEDAILIEYVKKHGEGNWNAVQRNCGLLRCGKSCRLRWANHLRPNLKKGSFTPDEERLIIELHAKIGNKWARMASQLPGRTDNEIKNYWNTRVKRLQRAGLPIYPDDVPYSYQNNPTFQQASPNSPISPPLHFSQFNTSISLNPILHFPRIVNPPFRFTGHFPMPLTNAISSFTSPRTSLYSQSFRMGGQISSFGLFNAPGKVELSSIQTWTANTDPSTPALSTTSGSGGHNVTREQEEGCFKIDAFEEGNNSGLLEVLLEESNTLAKAQNMKRNNSFCDGLANEVSEEESNGGPNFSPFGSSCGMKDEPMDEMNQLDDDLSSLLDNFPLSSPVPDWYKETATTLDVDTHKEQNSGPVVEKRASSTPKWSMGSCCWNNMASIC